MSCGCPVVYEIPFLRRLINNHIHPHTRTHPSLRSPPSIQFTRTIHISVSASKLHVMQSWTVPRFRGSVGVRKMPGWEILGRGWAGLAQELSAMLERDVFRCGRVKLPPLDRYVPGGDFWRKRRIVRLPSVRLWAFPRQRRPVYYLRCVPPRHVSEGRRERFARARLASGLPGLRAGQIQ